MTELYIIKSTVTDKKTGESKPMYTPAESTETANALIKTFNRRVQKYNIDGYEIAIHHEIYKLLKGAVINND